MITIKKAIICSIIILFGVPALSAEPIVTESTTNSTVTTQGEMTTTVKSPPPSAISPQFNTGNNSDLCTIGVAGAVQTQILGISAGMTYTEDNCIRLKNAKTLYDMGMKVAAVSTMCQDERVFRAMMQAGTPCPYDGMIGEAARSAWEENPEMQPGQVDKRISDENKSTLIGGGVIGTLLLILLL